MFRIVMLAAMLAGMLSVAGCGAQEGPGESSGGGEETPDFGVTTLDGEEFNLAEKRGEVVALYFMAGY